MTNEAKFSIALWIVRRFFEIWVILYAAVLALGLVGTWIMLPDDSGETLVLGDFIYTALMAWLMFISGFLSGYTFKPPISTSFARIYIGFYGLTLLAVMAYFIKSIGYLHAPLQHEVYDMLLSPTPARLTVLLVAVIGLGVVSLPQLIHHSDPHSPYHP